MIDKIVTYQVNNNFIIGVIVIAAILCVSFIISIIKFDTNAFKKSVYRNVKKSINTYIYKKDRQIEYSLNKKGLRPKLNLFLYDIKIDMEMFKEATLFQFKMIIYVVTFILTAIMSLFIFNNLLTMLFIYPMIYIAVVSMLFFNTVNKKRQRLLDIINTENLLSIEMNRGFETVVEDNINNIPVNIRQNYMNFINNRKRLNYSSSEAISRLKMELGTYSWNFLDKVDLYENHRENETDVEMFKDIVILNQIRSRGYNEIDKVIRSVRASFWASIGMSVGLWVLELILIKAVRWFYFSFIAGQILLIINILLLILVNLRLQILNSEEL